MSTTSVMGGVIKRREDPALIQGKGIYVDDAQSRRDGSHGLHPKPVRPCPDQVDRHLEGQARCRESSPSTRIDDVSSLGPLLAQVPIGKLRPLLADGVVKHVGEAVVLVVADSPAQARDAADAIEVDYDPMKAIVDLKEAASNKVKVHDDLDSNILHSWTYHGYWAALGLESQKPKIEAAKEARRRHRRSPRR